MSVDSVGTWKVGTVTAVRSETPTGRSIEIDVPGWGGNLAGQHLDVRLTAPDGYQAVRSYSIASADATDHLELAVDRLPDGEVSPYLVDDLLPGDQLEVRGPLGGWFVWRPEQTEPVQLIGGGSGIVPLVAIARAHAASGSTAPFRLLYSVRTPEDVFFKDELARLASPTFEITWVYTRAAPADWPTKPGRVSHDILAASVIPAGDNPSVFVCGPTGFVESVADLLVALGHPAASVKTERFGGA
ncbi:ferredoxin-NADP reductase [Conyzicola lurida]|uniref:Ferredoxin-NADP reductase n=1 Tax=Conyzicola lurida TaxID=1172621 RepID=A0A841AQ54_9MICO|nr:ferredoxin-NADP reductase [Conyzicola lurida]